MVLDLRLAPSVLARANTSASAFVGAAQRDPHEALYVAAITWACDRANRSA